LFQEIGKQKKTFSVTILRRKSRTRHCWSKWFL